jgi:UDP-N-acetylglucosamine 2-epimerase
VGARPQFIKAAIVSLKLKERGIEETLIHTGQHYDANMSDIFFKELEISEPDYHLGVGSGPHGEQTGQMLTEIERVLMKEKPGLVMVYGDTNTTLAGALAASKLHIPVAHVEAGLRSFNRRMPEEINRVLTDHAADLLFCPTGTGIKNLQTEGFGHTLAYNDPLPDPLSPLPLAVNVGDVMLDIASKIKKSVNNAQVLERLGLKEKDFILVTIHRAENTDERENLDNIWQALKTIALTGKRIFFPIHPRTRKALESSGLLTETHPFALRLNDPVTYTDMLALESSARLIITDSGGVQKEGYFLDTPCIVTREQTEWVEVADAGWTVLSGANKEKIIACVNELWDKSLTKGKEPVFGDGTASDKIAEIIKKI